MSPRHTAATFHGSSSSGEAIRVHGYGFGHAMVLVGLGVCEVMLRVAGIRYPDHSHAFQLINEAKTRWVLA